MNVEKSCQRCKNIASTACFPLIYKHLEEKLICGGIRTFEQVDKKEIESREKHKTYIKKVGSKCHD